MTSDDNNDIDNLDNDNLDSEELQRQLAKMFNQLAKHMDKSRPGFKLQYDTSIKGMETFRDAVREVVSEHDVWLSAASNNELGDNVLHILVYLDVIYQLVKKGAMFDDAYFFSCIAEMLKWSFLRGMKYAELREAPDAFSSFIDDLNID